MTDRPVLTFRVAWWVVAYGVMFLVGMVSALLSWTGGAARWPAAVLGLVAAALLVRTLRTAVFAYPDRLVIRNFVRTERIDRAQIDGFGIGRSTTSPANRALVVSTRHGRCVSADALTSTFPGPIPLGLGRARRAADRLQEWLSGPVG